MNATNNTVLRSYVWGIDLSGTQTGAGGVGGLLIMNDVQNGTHFYGYDGNGNVALMVNCDNGKESANYEYGPFGEVIKQTGLMSKINPFRFSTKSAVDSIDIILYEYRAYSPTIGRWLSRDPIGGGEENNLYSFNNNSAINYFDILGLFPGVSDTSGNFHPISTLAITRLEVEMQGYEVCKATGLLDALSKLKGVIPNITRVTIDPSYLGQKASAEYVVSRNWMRLKGYNPDGLDIVHETVHAYNNLVSGLSNNDRTDEGMAYTVEQTYTTLNKFRLIEDLIKAGCEANRLKILSRWQEIWRSYATPGHFPGGQLNDWGRTPFKLTGNDFFNVREHFGLKFSCGIIANALTKLSYHGGCCLFFTCDSQSSSPYSIPSGVKIDDSFK